FFRLLLLFLSLLIPPVPRSTLFPYTTLFRSWWCIRWNRNPQHYAYEKNPIFCRRNSHVFQCVYFWMGWFYSWLGTGYVLHSHILHCLKNNRCSHTRLQRHKSRHH